MFKIMPNAYNLTVASGFVAMKARTSSHSFDNFPSDHSMINDSTEA